MKISKYTRTIVDQTVNDSYDNMVRLGAEISALPRSLNTQRHQDETPEDSSVISGTVLLKKPGV